MNKDMIRRMKTAGMYQKKAIRALFPEEMSEHIDVIENELKAMFMEMAMDIYMNAKMDDVKDESCEEEKERSSEKDAVKNGKRKTSVKKEKTTKINIE